MDLEFFVFKLKDAIICTWEDLSSFRYISMTSCASVGFESLRQPSEKAVIKRKDIHHFKLSLNWREIAQYSYWKCLLIVVLKRDTLSLFIQCFPTQVILLPLGYYWIICTPHMQHIQVLFPARVETDLAYNNKWHIRPRFNNRYSNFEGTFFFLSVIVNHSCTYVTTGSI